MGSVCQIYDETTSTVLFDFNDPTAANVGDLGYSSTVLLENTNLGEPAMEFSRFSPPQRDGGSTVYQRAGFRTVTFRFRMRAAVYDSLASALGRLSQYLNAGCVIRWQANTSSLTKFIDVEPSPSPYAMDGRELSSYLATSLVDTPDGLTLTLTCQPYLRGAELDSAVNLLSNATLLRDGNLDGTPTSWNFSAGTPTVNAAAEAFQIVAVGASNVIYQDVAATPGQQFTLSAYARRISGSGTAKIQLEYLNAGLGSVGSNESTGVTTSYFSRDTLTTTAPANTAWVRCQLKVQTAAATCQWKNAQLELASAASTFRVGSETTSVLDPATGMGRLFPIYNPSDARAPLNIYQGNTSVAWSTSTLGLATGKLLVDYINSGAVQQIENWTNGTDTAGTVQAGSSPGSGTSAKLTTFATTTLVVRASTTISSTTLLNVLRGHTWRAIVRIVARTATYNGQVRLTATVGQTFLDKTITITGLTTSTYYEVDFGAVSFPDVALSNINLSLYASRTSGTGNLEWDFLMWAPGENYATASAGSVVQTTGFMLSDPKQQTAYTLDASLLATEVATVAGAVQVWVPPGLSILYSLATNNAVTVGGARGDAQSLRAKLSPRYIT